jgi:hypothetical protein
MTDVVRETARWAREVGLEVPKRKGHWQIDMRLYAWNGSKVSALLVVSVWATAWDVTLHYANERFFYGRCQGEPSERDGKAPIPPPRTLGDVHRWIQRVEKKLRVRFRRDAPKITSTIKGGKAAMAAWIGDG